MLRQTLLDRFSEIRDHLNVFSAQTDIKPLHRTAFYLIQIFLIGFVGHLQM